MTAVTIIGRVTGEPELRFTAGGDAVVQLSVAENHRKKVGNEWQDDGVTFWRCQAWKQTAENIAESLAKGMGVIIVGETKTRSWTDKQGETRTSLEVRIDDIGPSIRWATAKVDRAGGTSSSGGGQQQPGGSDDPWGSAPPAGGYGDTPPF